MSAPEVRPARPVRPVRVQCQCVRVRCGSGVCSVCSVVGQRVRAQRRGGAVRARTVLPCLHVSLSMLTVSRYAMLARVCAGAAPQVVKALRALFVRGEVSSPSPRAACSRAASSYALSRG